MTKNKIFQKIKNHSRLNPSDIEYLLSLDDFTEIYKLAQEITEKNFSNRIDIRAIIEFSNYCKRKCLYCGLNSNNKKLTRYRMNENEILSLAIKAYNAGYKTCVLQSGEDSFFTAEKIADIIYNIKKKVNIKITISSGEMSYEDYKIIKDAGADRYLLKHETSDNEIYSSLHSISTLENRLNCLKNLKKLGYETGSGFMIGLPRQTLKTIANDIVTLRDIPCDMAGIGPFIPHPNTPLKNMSHGNLELTKRAVALTRITLPKANLPCTTSLGTLDKEERSNIFSCGANVIMQKVTPQKYEKFYEIYPSNIEVKDIYEERKNLENYIKSLSKNPV